MRVRIAVWAFALLPTISLADDTPQAIVGDLGAIRDSVADDDQGEITPLRANDQEFAEAVERLRQQESRRDRPQPPVTPPQEYGPRQFLPPHAPRPRPDHWQAPPQQHPWSAWGAENTGWAQPQDPHHGQMHAGIPSPEARLREVAHRLDGLAHELEMAELFEAADSVRATAQQLRKQARPAEGT